MRLSNLTHKQPTIEESKMTKHKTSGLLVFFLTAMIGLIGGGLIAGIMGCSQSQELREEARAERKGWTLENILVASRDIAEGTVVNMEMVQPHPIPERFVTGSVVRPDSVNYIVGQRLGTPLQQGDLFRWADFEFARARPISHEIGKQRRAVRIPIEGKCRTEAWIQPGDHVDLVYVGPPDPARRGDDVARLLVENAVVLASGGVRSDSSPGLLSEDDLQCDTVVVMLMPGEALSVSLALAKGQVIPILRNPKDMDSLDSIHVTSGCLHDERKIADLLEARLEIQETRTRR